jgi:DNA-binding HxlR family transcriptional regulator
VAERAIMLQVLRADRDWRWTLQELQAEIDDLNPSVLQAALRRLERQGLVVAWGEWVLASRAALHLDELGMVVI